MNTDTHTALREAELKKLLDDPRTGLRNSSDTNKTRYAILTLFEDTLPRSTGTESWEEFDKKFVFPDGCVDVQAEELKDFISQHFVSRAEVERIIDSPAYKNLQDNKLQADEDGTMVVVSRQALDEILEDLKQALLQ